MTEETITLPDGDEIKLDTARKEIARQIQFWLDYDRDKWKKQGEEPPEGAQIKSLPYHLGYSQLKNWIAVLEA